MNNITSPSQVSSMHWPPGPVMGVHVQQVWPASAPRLLVLVSGERAIWALKSPADRDWHQLTSGSQPVIKVAIKWKFFFCCDNVRVYKLGNRKKIKKIGELKFKFFTKLNLFHQYTYTMYTLKTERFINLVFDKKKLVLSTQHHHHLVYIMRTRTIFHLPLNCAASFSDRDK